MGTFNNPKDDVVVMARELQEHTNKMLELLPQPEAPDVPKPRAKGGRAGAAVGYGMLPNTPGQSPFAAGSGRRPSGRAHRPVQKDLPGELPKGKAGAKKKKAKGARMVYCNKIMRELFAKKHYND